MSEDIQRSEDLVFIRLWTACGCIREYYVPPSERFPRRKIEVALAPEMMRVFEIHPMSQHYGHLFHVPQQVGKIIINKDDTVTIREYREVLSKLRSVADDAKSVD